MAKYQYKCNGCGKILNSNTYYPDGQWICVKCRNTTKVHLKCSVCGNEFGVAWDTYRMKDPNTPWRCRRCNDDYRNQLYENKSDEDKQKFVESQRQRSKSYWNNLSKEDKEKDSQRRKDIWNKRHETGEDQIIFEAMKKGRADWWNSLSEEEKIHQWNYMNNGRDKWWKSLSEEEKNAHMIYPHQGFSNWFRSLSKPEQIEFMKPIRKAHKEFWNNMTSEKYQNWKVKCNIGYRKYLTEINPWNPNVISNKNELAFINEISVYKIPFTFQCPSIKIHPDFNKLFPINPVTGADLIDATHMWDFMVHTRESNVFVDIDGSMHFKDTYTRTHPYSGKTYKELDSKKFDDSQRPYQTDGLPAYVVLCYDDNLTKGTLVENVITKEKITFDTFLSLLIWMNLSDKEKKEMMKL